MEGVTLPRGLIVDLISPFNQEGRLERGSLERHLSRVMPFAQALFLASPRMGEGQRFTAIQRGHLLEGVMDFMDRESIPLFVWVTQGSEEETVHTVQTLESVLEGRTYGGEVYWVDTPLYYHSNRCLSGLYQRLSGVVHREVILHNDPDLIKGLGTQLKRNNIRTAILKELVALPAMGGLIFLGSLDRGYNYQRACRGRPDFRIYDGDEDHFLNHPSMSGVVSAGANLAPKAWQAIIQSSLQLGSGGQDYPDHVQQVWELGQYLRELRDLYHPRPLAIIRATLTAMGVMDAPLHGGSLRQDVEEAVRGIRDLMASQGDWP